MKTTVMIANNTFRKLQNLLRVGSNLLFWGLLFSSCETLVNDVDKSRLPSSEPKLVVHGYVSPQDTLLQIAVAYNSSVFGQTSIAYSQGSFSIPDATVRISNQGKSVTLPFDAKNSVYSIKSSAMPIVAGQTYVLDVVFQGVTVTSSCTVPKAVAIKEILIDSVDSRNYSSNSNTIRPKDYLYRLVWQDIAGEANFYRVAGYSLQLLKVQTAPNKFEEHTNLFQIGFRDNTRDGDLISDERSDGTLLISRSGRYPNYNTGSNTTVLSTRIELMLLSCEKSYYDYHRSVQYFDDDNPFAEPSLIFSNIKGGLGCFSAYNRSSVVLKK